MIRIYGMITAMWASIVAGGALLVLVLGPLSLPGGALATSAAQAASAVGLVSAWAVLFYSLARRLYGGAAPGRP